MRITFFGETSRYSQYRGTQEIPVELKATTSQHYSLWTRVQTVATMRIGLISIVLLMITACQSNFRLEGKLEACIGKNVSLSPCGEEKKTLFSGKVREDGGFVLSGRIEKEGLYMFSILDAHISVPVYAENLSYE